MMTPPMSPTRASAKLAPSATAIVGWPCRVTFSSCRGTVKKLISSVKASNGFGPRSSRILRVIAIRSWLRVSLQITSDLTRPRFATSWIIFACSDDLPTPPGPQTTKTNASGLSSIRQNRSISCSRSTNSASSRRR